MPKLCAPVVITSENKGHSEISNDGFGYLDQLPPDLEGITGTSFMVAAHVDIQSHLLLDILSDKPQTMQKGQSRQISLEMSSQSGAIVPLEAEWES